MIQLLKSKKDRCFTAILSLTVMILLAVSTQARAQDVSSAPFLQIFDASYDTVEDRLADMFVAGYERLWLPPPARADSGSLSVGYDVFDRFDLGSPRNETLYGTETGLKTLINQAHRAGIKVNTDFIANHNGFSDNSTVDGRGTPAVIDDVTFVESGGYPGFVLEAPGLPFGDFHDPSFTGEEFFRLAGLIDINQSLNNQYIRSPVEVGNPQNIPAGTEGIFGRPPANVPDPNNARFYPDQALGSTTVFDPALNQNVTLYDFNTVDPLAGDAYTENATGLLIRNIRWMIQEVGVDGFRYDAARHFPRWVLDFLDHGSFLANKDTLLDGSPDHPFTFIETGGDSSDAFIDSFIRKDINNADLSTLGGNRDSLDFNLFFDIRANLSDNGVVNDWRNIKNSSVDIVDDGLANNGSQGVGFVQSHDDGPAHLNNVAHAYALMRPGNALVYFNADEFDNPFRDFPKDGRGDALGGMFGDRVTTLTAIRNSHGRGNYMDRTPGADEKEILIYERENSALVVLSNRLDDGFDSRTVQTGFAPGTPLVELTGNAADGIIDPNDDIAEVLIVKPDGTVDLRVQRNSTGGVEHGNGYLIYGVATPEGQMRLTNTAGADLNNVLAGSTPMPGDGGMNGPTDNQLNGTTRLTDITVVTDSQFKLRLETDAVTLPGGIRDRHADGDFAQFRIDDGRDKDGNVIADVVTPGDVGYAFSNFTDTSSPGFFNANGEGVFEQTIDTTQLAEGRHYLTGRVYRHRNPGTFTDGDMSTSGDGGPAVFTDFREVIYVDLLPPESEVVSFEPFASNPGNPNDRDLIVRSTDGTANNMHVFFDLPAGMSDAQILQMALNGQNSADGYDRDQWIAGIFGVTSGNHVATVVTFEPTGNSSVRRFAGLSTDTNIGAGIGDTDSDGVFEVSDISGVGGFEELLASNNNLFNAAADANADGLIDTRDLLDLGPALLSGGAASPVLNEYSEALLRRADLDSNGQADSADLELLYSNAGSSDALYDLNLDGVVDADDAQLMITGLFRTVAGDFNLDGEVDAADYTLWRDGLAGSSLVADGDFDGDVDQNDFSVWAAAFGFSREAFGAGSSVAVPEPAAATLLSAMLMTMTLSRGRRGA